MIVCTTNLNDMRKYIMLYVYDTTLPTYSHYTHLMICFLALYKKYVWLICIRKFHPFLFLKSNKKCCQFSLVKHFMEKPFLISSLIEISFRKGILPIDSYTKVLYTVLGLAS